MKTIELDHQGLTFMTNMNEQMQYLCMNKTPTQQSKKMDSDRKGKGSR